MTFIQKTVAGGAILLSAAAAASTPTKPDADICESQSFKQNDIPAVTDQTVFKCGHVHSGTVADFAKDGYRISYPVTEMVGNIAAGASSKVFYQILIQRQ